MTKYILIGGRIHKAQDGGKAFCEELSNGVEHQPIKILDCLFARPEDSWGERFKQDQEFFSSNMRDVEIELASAESFVEQIKNADVLVFQGGKPRDLMAVLETTGDWQKEIQGKVIAGSSGGADALCKYYGVGRTGNVGEGLGLLPIKFLPHWKSDYSEGVIIDWDAVLEKLKSHKENLEVVVLAEGEFKIFNI
jgi:peptidase E